MGILSPGESESIRIHLRRLVYNNSSTEVKVKILAVAVNASPYEHFLRKHSYRDIKEVNELLWREFKATKARVVHAFLLNLPLRHI